MNKYVFFREYYKPICIAPYNDDARAELEAQKLANEIGEAVIVCRHLTQRAADLAVCTCPKVGSEIYHVVGCPATFPPSPNR